MEMNPKLLEKVSTAMAEALGNCPGTETGKVYVCDELLQALAHLDKSLNLLLAAQPVLIEKSGLAASEVGDEIQIAFEKGCAVRDSVINIMAEIAKLVW